MKFVPIPVIKSTIATSNTFIRKQQHFEKNTMTFRIRNLRPPDTIIHYKNMEDSKEYDLTVWEILQNLTDNDNKSVFSAVVKHGLKPDTLLLSGPRKNEELYKSFHYNLTEYVQGLLPGLLPSDLFSTPTQVLSMSDMQYRNAKAKMEQQ